MKTELNLYDYWRIIRRKKWLAAAVFGAVMVSAAFYTEQQPAIYRSQAILKFNPPASYLKTPGADLTDWENVHTEIKILSSEEITRQAAEKLGLAAENMRENSRIVKELRSMYEVERVENSNLISIYADTLAPAKSCRIINAVVDAYKNYDIEKRSSQIRQMLDDMTLKKSEAEENLHSLERVQQDFLRKNAKAGLGSALANHLIDLEIRKKELLEKYTSNYPEISKIEQGIGVVQAKLAELPEHETELARISRELRMQEDLYMTLNKKAEEMKLGLASIVSFIIVMAPPTPADKPVYPIRALNYSLGAILGAVFTLLVIFLLEQFNITISTIEEVEEFLSLPILALIPEISAPGGKKRGLFGWALGKNRRSAESVRDFLILHQRETQVIEFYHTLRTNIAAQNFKSQASRGYEDSTVKLPVKPNPRQDMAIIVTSPNMGEGKTLTAVNFSLACANSGLKTLLVDGDLRAPAIHRVFGLNFKPGLAEILSDKIMWEDSLNDKKNFDMGVSDSKQVERFPGIENLKIITAGVPPDNVIDLLGLPQWEEMIEDWKYEFNAVIMDAPPVLAYADTTLMVNYLNGVVLVYRFGRTPRGALKRAKEQLTDINARILGIVFNEVKISEITSQYGSCYYYDYKKRARV